MHENHELCFSWGHSRGWSQARGSHPSGLCTPSLGRDPRVLCACFARPYPVVFLLAVPISAYGAPRVATLLYRSA